MFKKVEEIIREVNIYKALAKKFPNADHETLCNNQKRLLSQEQN